MAFTPDPQHPLPPEYPTWLDYSTIYIAHGADARDQLAALRRVVELAKAVDTPDMKAALAQLDEVNFK